LHLLRLFLHEYWNLKNLIIPKKSISFFVKKNQRFFLFLYNSHEYEYESVFFFLCKQSFHFRLTFYPVFLERIYFYEKIEHFVEVFTKDWGDSLCLLKDPFIHYIRYQGKSIFVSKDTPLPMKKWKYYFVNLYQCHFDMCFQPQKIHINLFSLYKHSFILLSYLSSSNV
jgi:hypothetical protein